MISMKETKEVAILMSTYNGGLFLSAQIESIINQVYTNWTLYIRDDGSSDDTNDIINFYCRKDARISYMEDKVIHRGVKDSFLWMLQNIDCEYFMFCDQDDIWLPDKINLSLAKLQSVEKKNPNCPCLVVTDLKIVDRDGKVLYESMWNHLHINKIVQDPSFLIVAPMYTGCTMIFNKMVKGLALKNASARHLIHDQIVALSTYKAGGKIGCLQQSTILYRQHENNVIGAERKKHTFVQSAKSSWQYYKKVNNILRVNFLLFIKKKLTRISRFV